MPDTTTLVVVRRWRSDGCNLLALFPEIPSDIFGRYCLSYARLGQHSGADYYGVIQATRPVTASEAAPLLRELRRIGYQLRPIKRASRKHHETRRATARSLR